MIRPINPEELERIVQAFRAKLLKANGNAAEVLARIGADTESQIIRMLLDGDYVVDQKQLARLQSMTRRILAGSSEQAMQLMEEYIPAILDLAVAKEATSIARMEGVASWQQVSDRRILETFDHLERGVQDRTLTRMTGPYVERWRSEWADNWTGVQREIQSSFTRAAMTGQRSSEVAKRIADKLETLTTTQSPLAPGTAIPIRGHMNPEDFAKAFARTKQAELYNDFSVAVAVECGLEQFVNIGVPDDRQSEICYRASQLGPLTLAQWETAPTGPPKRHVLNCRCDLVGVTPRVARTVDFKQSNPKFDSKELAAAAA